MEKIKDVTVNYISGRHENLGISEALAALNRSDFAEGKPNVVVLFEKQEPFLKIYRSNREIIFEASDGIKQFADMDALKAELDKYWLTLYCFNVLDKSIYDVA